MGGGLLQLVATGAQDIFLTGNPEMSFLKVYIRDIQIFLRKL